MHNSTATPKVFVSYSRADTKEVLPLVDRMEEETGVHFWIDREGIESAAQFEEVIIRAIDQAEVVLFMLSDNSQHSQWTKDEISYAKNTGKRVVPIVLHGGELQGWFLFKFGRINYIDATQDDQVQRLAADIREWLHIKGEQRQDREKSPKPGPEPEVTEVRGSILVQCLPAGAEILIDGKKVGITPRKIGGISAGRHQVEIRASGYASRSWTVDVSAGVTSEVKGALTAKAAPPAPSRTLLAILVGTLVAVVVVVGVCVYLGTRQSGIPGRGDTPSNDTIVRDTTTVVEQPETASGSENVELALQGPRHSESGSMNQEDEKPTGSINVTCGPKGSTIKIDGKSVGTTPKEIEGLSVGSHTVEVSKSGYESRSWIVIVKANGTIYLSEDLAEKQLTSAASGSINGHDYVDLGLSVKWATCNVGASSPSDYGNYYAWGETTTKSTYTSENSKTYDNSSYDYDIGGKSSLDAARANWGGTWRLPTAVEFQELFNNCTWTWTTQGGKNGYKVTSKKNGSSIFLPAAGDGSSLGRAGENGFYWSSSLNGSDSNYAWYLSANSSGRYPGRGYRFLGFSVRPVSE